MAEYYCLEKGNTFLVTLNDSLKGNVLNKASVSAHRSVLTKLESVNENNADVGFGFDGDGDRVGVIDNTGKEIFSDKIGLLIARNLASNHKNKKFVVDVKSTGLFEKDKILLKNNCNTIYWKTGHSHIKRKVNETGALAGFEKSGHVFFN